MPAHWPSLGPDKHFLRVLWGETAHPSYQRVRAIPEVARAIRQIDRDGIDLRPLVQVAQGPLSQLNRQVARLRRLQRTPRADVLAALRKFQRQTDPLTAKQLQPSIDLLTLPAPNWPPSRHDTAAGRLKDPASFNAIQYSNEARAVEEAVFVAARAQLLRAHPMPGMDDREYGKIRGLDSKAARYTFLVLDSLRSPKYPLVDPPATNAELLELITPALPKAHRLFDPVDRIRSRVAEKWNRP